MYKSIKSRDVMFGTVYVHVYIMFMYKFWWWRVTEDKLKEKRDNKWIKWTLNTDLTHFEDIVILLGCMFLQGFSLTIHV